MLFTWVFPTASLYGRLLAAFPNLVWISVAYWGNDCSSRPYVPRRARHTSQFVLLLKSQIKKQVLSRIEDGIYSLKVSRTRAARLRRRRHRRLPRFFQASEAQVSKTYKVLQDPQGSTRLSSDPTHRSLVEAWSSTLTAIRFWSTTAPPTPSRMTNPTSSSPRRHSDDASSALAPAPPLTLAPSCWRSRTTKAM
jgi:hypothetical protein